MVEPVHQPQPLDAYLELKHTVIIMTQQVPDLEQQKKSWRAEEVKLEEENHMLKSQCEEEVKRQ